MDGFSVILTVLGGVCLGMIIGATQADNWVVDYSSKPYCIKTVIKDKEYTRCWKAVEVESFGKEDE